MCQSQNPFNPFTVADATIPNFFPDGRGLPVTTGVGFRAINDTGPRHERFTYWDSLFDVGLRGEMGEFGDYFKSWNWERVFVIPGTRGRICRSTKPVSLDYGKHFWIRTQLPHLIRS